LLVAYLDRVNVSVLLADHKFIADMGIKADAAKQGLIMTIFLLAYGIGNMLLGSVGDMMGPRKAMSLSIFLWTVAVTIGGTARGIGSLLVSRFLLGAGEAMHWPMQSTYVKNWFPPKERARANAAWLVGLMVGPALAMPIFAHIVGNYGWRASFFFLGALGLLLPLPLIWFLTRDYPRQHKMVGEAELRYIEEGQKEEITAQDSGSFGKNLVALLKNIRFWLITIGYIANASIWWGIMTWLPKYLSEARGFSWSNMGYLSALPYIVGTFSVILISIISDKMMRRALFYSAGLFGTALFIYLAAMTQSNMASAIYISIGIFCFGFNLPTAWSILQSIVPSNLTGTAAGLMNGISNLLSAVAPLFMGYLINTTGSYVGGLMYLIVWGLIGGICTSILAVQKY